jgi:hypothetical protein
LRGGTRSYTRLKVSILRLRFDSQFPDATLATRVPKAALSLTAECLANARYYAANVWIMLHSTNSVVLHTVSPELREQLVSLWHASSDAVRLVRSICRCQLIPRLRESMELIATFWLRTVCPRFQSGLLGVWATLGLTWGVGNFGSTDYPMFC